MKIKSLTFLLLTLPLSSTAHSSAGISWTCDQLNQMWPKFHADLKVAWPLTSFSCPSSASKIAEAIALIHDVHFRPDASGYAPYFYDWLVQNAKTFDYSEETKAIAIANYHGTGVVTIMKPFFDAPLYQRAAVLIHETRHIASGIGHVACDHGSDKGALNCDTEFRRVDWNGGAYSFGFLYMWWLSESSDAVSPAEQSKITSLLKWELLNRYNYVNPQDMTYFKAHWNWNGL